MNCAAERIPPSSEYLLLDDQPAIMKPTVGTPPIAITYSTATFRSVSAIPLFQGITAQTISEKASTISGATKCRKRSARDGTTSSLVSSFKASATDCSSPNG